MIQVEDSKGLPGDQYIVLNKNTGHGKKKQQNHGKKRKKGKHPKKNGTKKPVVGTDYRGFVPDEHNPETEKSRKFISKFVQQNYQKSG